MYAGFQDYKQNFKIDESCILWKALDIIVLKAGMKKKIGRAEPTKVER